MYAALLALFVIGVVYTGHHLNWFEAPAATREVVMFMFLAHVGLYVLINKLLGQRPEDFVKIYLGITVLRILFFGMFIFAVIFLNPAGAHSNVVVFLISYFLFTALEVTALFSKINGQKPGS